MYLTTQDWPTIYKLSLEDPLGARTDAGGGAAAAGQKGRTIFEERCQACHRLNDAPPESGPPPLAGIGKRLAFDSFRLTVRSGRGEMPAFPDLDGAALTTLFAFLGSPDGTGRGGGTNDAASRPIGGPVVASGGAPGGLNVQADGNAIQPARRPRLIRLAVIRLAIATTRTGVFIPISPTSSVRRGRRSWPLT